MQVTPKKRALIPAFCMLRYGTWQPKQFVCHTFCTTVAPVSQCCVAMCCCCASQHIKRALTLSSGDGARSKIWVCWDVILLWLKCCAFRTAAAQTFVPSPFMQMHSRAIAFPALPSSIYRPLAPMTPLLIY